MGCHKKYLLLIAETSVYHKINKQRWIKKKMFNYVFILLVATLNLNIGMTSSETKHPAYFQRLADIQSFFTTHNTHKNKLPKTCLFLLLKNTLFFFFVFVKAYISKAKQKKKQKQTKKRVINEAPTAYSPEMATEVPTSKDLILRPNVSIYMCIYNLHIFVSVILFDSLENKTSFLFVHPTIQTSDCAFSH